MNILVLDGAAVDDLEAQHMAELVRQRVEAAKLQFEWMSLRHLSVAPCQGCFGCWVDNPGKCIQKDDAQTIAASWMRSDIVVLITRMTYGGYSSLMKKALDRQIGMLHPYFISTKQGTLHMPRYKRYPSLVVFGICSQIDKDEDDVFKRMVRQNGITMRMFSSRSQILLASEKEEISRDKIDSGLLGVRVR